jgi:hypothetical protein
VWRQDPLGRKKLCHKVALRFEGFKFKYFWIWFFTHSQSCEIKNRLDGLMTRELFNEPWLRKTKTSVIKQFQPTAWPRNNRTPYYMTI